MSKNWWKWCSLKREYSAINLNIDYDEIADELGNEINNFVKYIFSIKNEEEYISNFSNIYTKYNDIIKILNSNSINKDNLDTINSEYDFSDILLDSYGISTTDLENILNLNDLLIQNPSFENLKNGIILNLKDVSSLYTDTDSIDQEENVENNNKKYSNISWAVLLGNDEDKKNEFIKSNGYNNKTELENDVYDVFSNDRNINEIKKMDVYRFVIEISSMFNKYPSIKEKLYSSRNLMEMIENINDSMSSFNEIKESEMKNDFFNKIKENESVFLNTSLENNFNFKKALSIKSLNEKDKELIELISNLSNKILKTLSSNNINDFDPIDISKYLDALYSLNPQNKKNGNKELYEYLKEYGIYDNYFIINNNLKNDLFYSLISDVKKIYDGIKYINNIFSEARKFILNSDFKVGEEKQEILDYKGEARKILSEMKDLEKKEADVSPESYSVENFEEKIKILFEEMKSSIKTLFPDIKKINIKELRDLSKNKISELQNKLKNEISLQEKTKIYLDIDSYRRLLILTEEYENLKEMIINIKSSSNDTSKSGNIKKSLYKMKVTLYERALAFLEKIYANSELIKTRIGHGKNNTPIKLLNDFVENVEKNKSLFLPNFDKKINPNTLLLTESSKHNDWYKFSKVLSEDEYKQELKKAYDFYGLTPGKVNPDDFKKKYRKFFLENNPLRYYTTDKQKYNELTEITRIGLEYKDLIEQEMANPHKAEGDLSKWEYIKQQLEKIAYGVFVQRGAYYNYGINPDSAENKNLQSEMEKLFSNYSFYFSKFLSKSYNKEYINEMIKIARKYYEILLHEIKGTNRLKPNPIMVLQEIIYCEEKLNIAVNNLSEYYIGDKEYKAREEFEREYEF